jgi:CelD/BcsL family acetyltransferase involved in cellulose biosynthesis
MLPAAKAHRPAAFTVREIDARAVPPEIVSGWAELESRALEPSAYLSPHFVLPAVRYLDPERPVLALVVESRQGGIGGRPTVAAVLVCRPVPGTRGFPLPHLRAYRSQHSYHSGVLVDRELAPEALAALLDHVSRRMWRWHGIEFETMWGDGAAYEVLKNLCADRGMQLSRWNEMTRAVLYPRADAERIQQRVSAEDRALKRRRRRLEEQGEVAWSVVCEGGVSERSIEAFLDLEHRGWKGDNKSSLRSQARGEAFFRAVVAGMGARDRAVFMELRLDGKVVATTSNFLSGCCGFAFKIGWLPELAKLSPGRLIEAELLRQLYTHQALLPLEFLDSGAPEGSYIESLWPGRRPLISLGVACTRVGHSVLGAVHLARTLYRAHRSRQATAVAAKATPPTPCAAGDDDQGD